MSFVNKILLNPNPTSNQRVVNSNLSLSNSYYSYNQNELGGGITNEFNIDQFLDSPKNEDISLGYFSFLTANTSQNEFKEIIQNKKKLSSLFNNFYQTTVVSGEESGQDLITPVFSGYTTTSLITNNNFKWNESLFINNNDNLNRPLSINSSFREHSDEKEFLVVNNNEDNYYINVDIKSNPLRLSNLDFSKYSQDCFREVETENGLENKFLTQCFVDLNKETNPNEKYFNFSLNDVGFNKRSDTVDEGQEIIITVSLSSVSLLGNEEVGIKVNKQESTASNNDYQLFYDGQELQSDSFLMTFNTGESQKDFTVLANSDFIVNDDNTVVLEFYSSLNVNSVLIDKFNLNIVDNTVLLVSQFDNLNLTNKIIGEEIDASLNNPLTIVSESAEFINSNQEIVEYSVDNDLTYQRIPLIETGSNGAFSNFSDDLNAWVVPVYAMCTLSFSCLITALPSQNGTPFVSVRLMTEDRQDGIIRNRFEPSKNTSNFGSNRSWYPVNEINDDNILEIEFSQQFGNFQANQDKNIYLEIGYQWVTTDFQAIEEEREITIKEASLSVKNVRRSRGRGENFKEVSFIEFDKDSNLTLPISLSQPSQSGLENVTFQLSNDEEFLYSSDPNNFNVSPQEINFDVGDSTKDLTISTNSNFDRSKGIVKLDVLDTESTNFTGPQSFYVVAK